MWSAGVAGSMIPWEAGARAQQSSKSVVCVVDTDCAATEGRDVSF